MVFLMINRKMKRLKKMSLIDHKITFENKGTNEAQLDAEGILAIQSQVEAEKNNNLPHNSLFVANLDTVSTLYIFLDDMQNQEVPAYVLFPSQSMFISVEDGESFTTVFIKNTHATNDIPANSIKYKVATIKDTSRKA